MTMTVAAGAVAEAIAPKSRAIFILTPSITKDDVTSIEAANAAKTAIIMALVPTFFRYASLNSEPIEKAMKAKAISDASSNSVTNSDENIFKQYGPKSSPAIRYPVTFG